MQIFRAIQDLVLDGMRLCRSVDRSQLNEVLGSLVGIGVIDVSITRPTLDDVFLRNYSRPSTNTSSVPVGIAP